MARSVCCLAVGLLIGTLLGCGGKGDDLPDRVPVEVTVTFKAAPVDGAHVTFVPPSGGKPAFGTTDAEGKAELTTFGAADGAIPGEYRVTIRKTKVDSASTLAPDDPNALAPVNTAAESKTTQLLPEKYGSAATSGLQARVTESGENRFTFALTE